MFNMIISALKFAADRVIESNGEIEVFSTDPDKNMQVAKTALELSKSTNADEADYACLGILTDLGYDDYGRLRKANYAIPTLEEWLDEAEKHHSVSLRIFPKETLERAHDYFRDLWLDNEKVGDNNPDGTFKSKK